MTSLLRLFFVWFGFVCRRAPAESDHGAGLAGQQDDRVDGPGLQHAFLGHPQLPVSPSGRRRRGRRRRQPSPRGNQAKPSIRRSSCPSALSLSLSSFSSFGFVSVHYFCRSPCFSLSLSLAFSPSIFRRIRCLQTKPTRGLMTILVSLVCFFSFRFPPPAMISTH